MTVQRLALDPPTGDLFVLEQATLDEVISASRSSARRRIIAPLHRSQGDPLHRMLNAMQPGTYVRPHRHKAPPKAESWLLLRGEVLFFRFDEQGEVLDCVHLSASGPSIGIDLVPGPYHSLAALAPDTVLYEVKSGPYEQQSDKAFAPWSPEEGTREADHYLANLLALHGP
jgi:cupin fold WbuC family metalloprotein